MSTVDYISIKQHIYFFGTNPLPTLPSPAPRLFGIRAWGLGLEHPIALTSLGCKPYTTAMGCNGCKGVFQHHQSFNDRIVNAGLLSGTVLVSFVHMVVFFF